MPAECCIFHRQRQFGEWSDDEDSDDEGGEGECLPGEENLVDTSEAPDLTAMLEEMRLEGGF